MQNRLDDLTPTHMSSDRQKPLEQEELDLLLLLLLLLMPALTNHERDKFKWSITKEIRDMRTFCICGASTIYMRALIGKSGRRRTNTLLKEGAKMVKVQLYSCG